MSPRQARSRNRRALRVLISSGPTREPLDPVRFLSNYSTGLMGACLAQETLRRGHAATVVSGPAAVALPRQARVISVERARQMRDALRGQASRADAIIMAAAVCDFEPAAEIGHKLPRRGTLSLRLKATPDIIGTLPRRPGQVVAGFALETDRPLERAAEKLKRKRLDLIIAQDAGRQGGAFGARPVRAWLLDSLGRVTALGIAPKRHVARALLDKIEALCYGATLARSSVASHRRRTRRAPRARNERGAAAVLLSGRIRSEARARAQRQARNQARTS